MKTPLLNLRADHFTAMLTPSATKQDQIATSCGWKTRDQIALWLAHETPDSPADIACAGLELPEDAPPGCLADLVAAVRDTVENDGFGPGHPLSRALARLAPGAPEGREPVSPRPVGMTPALAAPFGTDDAARLAACRDAELNAHYDAVSELMEDPGHEEEAFHNAVVQLLQTLRVHRLVTVPGATPVSPPEVCQGCKSRPAEPMHICPYKQDVNGDSTTLCNCCPACQHECAQDI